MTCDSTDGRIRRVEHLLDLAGEDGFVTAFALRTALEICACGATDSACAHDEWLRGQAVSDEERSKAAVDLVALSRWVNARNVSRSSDALLWIRLCKPAEEAGEVISALHEATGANPRKNAVEGMDAVVEELLDTAVAALAAVEHVRGHAGLSIGLMFDKVRRVRARADALAPADTPEAHRG